MKCVANFEIRTDISVVDDSLILRFSHPDGRYRVRIQNVPRTEFTTPFVLALHLYFDAPNLREAKDIAEELLAECLNILAFTTGASVRRHRIRQIVDADPDNFGARSILFWGDAIAYEDPQPFLDERIASGIDLLLKFDMPPAIRKAMRWYRLGIGASAPDDQYIYFWFALEIVAEFCKNTDKVPSKCPKCLTALYCECCKTHPVHRPYAKQAIRDLLNASDKNFTDITFERLDKARNTLMHGGTLRELDETASPPSDHIVDVLGRLLWRALVLQFPRTMFDGTLSIGLPSTYLHHKLSGIMEMQMPAPRFQDGDFDLRFSGVKAEMLQSGPPQSAQATLIVVSIEQHEKLSRLRFKAGEHQVIFQRIFDRSRKVGEAVHAVVLATDVDKVKEAMSLGTAKEWQDVFPPSWLETT